MFKLNRKKKLNPKLKKRMKKIKKYSYNFFCGLLFTWVQFIIFDSHPDAVIVNQKKNCYT
jgi:hypothetical protein